MYVGVFSYGWVDVGMLLHAVVLFIFFVIKIICHLF